MSDDTRNRHDEMANNVVGWVLAVAFAACCWWTLALPVWIPAVVNPVLVVAVAYGLARWKRSRFGWVMFWVLLAIQVVGFGADVLSGFTETAPSVLAGTAVLALVVWLVRLPHFHAAEPQVSHVVHHHVLQVPDGQAAQLPGWAGVSGTAVPGQVITTAAPELPVAARRAIEAPRVSASAFAGKIGERIKRKM